MPSSPLLHHRRLLIFGSHFSRRSGKQSRKPERVWLLVPAALTVNSVNATHGFSSSCGEFSRPSGREAKCQSNGSTPRECRFSKKKTLKTSQGLSACCKVDSVRAGRVDELGQDVPQACKIKICCREERESPGELLYIV